MQNYDLMDLLLDTKDAILAEASPQDKIWGIGLEENDPNSKDPESWRGQNLLGKILMQLREEFAFMWKRIDVGDLGVHAAFDQSADDYWVSRDQAVAMDELLKMVVHADEWAEKGIIVYNHEK